ncbi:MAG TPA: biotin/lipoyl-binding protein [Candidatus Lustribacter sp.]|jgi:acetyl-CoA carboxylase biotin carboxyl carrier protein|nr:biotin/lipoyl-binding protein [Candidatus Lustribacter sp.]
MFENTIVERVRPLAQAFSDGGLTRLRVRDGDFEVEFRRAPAAVSGAVADARPAGEPAPARPVDAILADVVGVMRFLRPAVGEGMTLDGDRELAYVETLGIRNPVRSRGPGRVAMIYVTDGQPVEYGQPLFAIER